MGIFAMYLIGFSIIGFLIAVVLNLMNTGIMGVSAEGFSRASNNLALIAIAIGVWWDKQKEPK